MRCAVNEVAAIADNARETGLQVTFDIAIVFPALLHRHQALDRHALQFTRLVAEQVLGGRLANWMIALGVWR